MNPYLLPYLSLVLGLTYPELEALYTIPSWTFVLRIIENRGWFLIEEATTETIFLYEKDGNYLRIDTLLHDNKFFHVNLNNTNFWHFTPANFQSKIKSLLTHL